MLCDRKQHDILKQFSPKKMDFKKYSFKLRDNKGEKNTQSMWGKFRRQSKMVYLNPNGNPRRCSCLENPRDGGAWWAAIYGVAQSWTRLKRRSSSSNRNLERQYWWTYLQGSRADADTETDLCTQLGKERVGRTERVASYTRETDSRWKFAIWHREPSLWYLEGWDGEGGFNRQGAYVYLRRLHVDAWQKPLQYYNHPPI